jgi:hypothetical protein
MTALRLTRTIGPEDAADVPAPPAASARTAGAAARGAGFLPRGAWA